MKKEDILNDINIRYLHKQMIKYPYTAPELLRQEIGSKQIQAVAEVFAEILEEMTENIKKENIKNLNLTDGKINTVKKLIE